MTTRQARRDAPEHFLACIEALQQVRSRPEVSLEEGPAPQRIAPHSTALTAEVVGSPDDEPAATGRFIVLHDPAGPEAWDGQWRLVTYATAQMEPEMGSDPLLGEVGWSWLEEALAEAGLEARALGGTVTRVISESFGALGERPSGVELEVRASWTVDGEDLAGHLRVWTDFLCTLGGLPPLPEGVVALPGIRR